MPVGTFNPKIGGDLNFSEFGFEFNWQCPGIKGIGKSDNVVSLNKAIVATQGQMRRILPLNTTSPNVPLQEKTQYSHPLLSHPCLPGIDAGPRSFL
jgi:hypothetical protein